MGHVPEHLRTTTYVDVALPAGLSKQDKAMLEKIQGRYGLPAVSGLTLESRPIYNIELQ
jgi:hypothetical protein